MNRLPWFTHDHDANEDGWIRNLVRKEGHVAGWLWWVMLEQLHKHGVGDTLKRDINDIAKSGLTSASVVIRVLTQMATEYEGQTKVRWKLVGTELQLEIKKFRERQSNLKSKLISKPFQDHIKTTIDKKDNKKEKDNKDIGGFAPPSISDVIAYCQERNNGVNPKNWLDHYTAKGWMIGKNKMKDWQAAVRTWEKDGAEPRPRATPKAIEKTIWSCAWCHKENVPKCPRDAWDGEICQECYETDLKGLGATNDARR